jgi:membrane protease YdiL (CAAX protease family)
MATHAILAYAASVLLIIFVGARLARHHPLAIGLLVTEVFFIAAPAAMVLLVNRKTVDFGVFGAPRLREAFLTAIMAVCVMFLSAYAGIAIRKSLFGLEGDASSSPLGTGLIYLFAATVGPLCEEFLFRPVIQNGLRRHFGNGPAMICAAMLFALFHMSIFRIPETLVFGLFVGIVFLKTNNYWCPVIAHVINNGVGIPVWMHAGSLKVLVNPFAAILFGIVALVCTYYLRRSPDRPESGVWRRIRWAVFGAPTTERRPAPRYFYGLLSVLSILMLGFIGYRFAMTPETATPDYVVSQSDVWMVNSSDEIHIVSTLILKKMPEDSADLPLVFHLPDVSDVNVTFEGESVAVSADPAGQYTAHLPHPPKLPSADPVLVTWRFPLSALASPGGGYRTPLRSLLPADSFMLTLRAGENSGNVLPGRGDGDGGICIFRALADPPKTTFGDTGLPIRRATH